MQQSCLLKIRAVEIKENRFAFWKKLLKTVDKTKICGIL